MRSSTPRLPLWRRVAMACSASIIGKATVPAMRSGDPLAKEVHSDLLDLAHWVDEQFEGMDEHE